MDGGTLLFYCCLQPCFFWTFWLLLRNKEFYWEKKHKQLNILKKHFDEQHKELCVIPAESVYLRPQTRADIGPNAGWKTGTTLPCARSCWEHTSSPSHHSAWATPHRHCGSKGKKQQNSVMPSCKCQKTPPILPQGCLRSDSWFGTAF